MIQPFDLGAPEKFASWRPEQQRAFEWLIAQGRRVLVVTAPPGVGKSLLGWSYARLLGARALYLTSTRGLEDQIANPLTGDFRETMFDIRGMGNYPCKALGNRMTCDAGPCLSGEKCPWRGEWNRKGGCDYFDADFQARESALVSSNYAYWLAHQANPTLGERDLLICDEAHDIPKLVAAAAGAEFSGKEIRLEEEGMHDWGWESWQTWAALKRAEAFELLESKRLGPSETREVRRLAGKLTRVASAGGGWAFEWVEGKRTPTIRFEPVRPAEYVEPLLLRGIPRILLLSATVRQPTLSNLGLGEQDYAMFEATSPFPVARRPIYWLGLGFRVTGKTTEDKLWEWVQRQDQVIESRLRWKGIIHTVSYARARFLQKHSRFARHMLLHDSSDTVDVVQRFKRMPAPAILVSPSVHTGWDFPFDQARWQIIAKVPMPDTRGGIAKARAAADRQYGQKEAIVTLQQMAGRVMRDTQDLGETIIVDDTIEWLYSHYRPWFARWFRDAFRPVTVIPPPLVV